MLLIRCDAETLDHRHAHGAELRHDDRVPFVPTGREPGPRRPLSITDLVRAGHSVPPPSMHPPTRTQTGRRRKSLASAASWTHRLADRAWSPASSYVVSSDGENCHGNRVRRAR